jgi:ABC-type lipoprotein release transport system permease subunit
MLEIIGIGIGVVVLIYVLGAAVAGNRKRVRIEKAILEYHLTITTIDQEQKLLDQRRKEAHLRLLEVVNGK